MTGYHRITGFLMVLLAVLCIWTSPAAAGRDLYIGDTVTLTIEEGYYTETQIRRAFEDFEVVSLIKEADVFEITVRTFETGHHEVRLGNDTIVFDVASTLDVFDRDTVFPVDETEKDRDWTFFLRALLYLSLGCVVISSLWLLVARFKNKKDLILPPFEAMKEAVGGIDPRYEGSLGKLNHAFKGYIYKVFGVNTMGMTSEELLMSLPSAGVSPELTSRIKHWLEAGDRYKYAGDFQEQNVFESMASEVLELAKVLEAERQVGEG